MEIRFTKHAQEKFEILRKHGIVIPRDAVIASIKAPDLIDRLRYPQLIAQGELDARHVLRVVYKIESGIAIIITFYPGRRTAYEKEK